LAHGVMAQPASSATRAEPSSWVRVVVI
jgi:hypothetical protein